MRDVNVLEISELVEF